MDVGANTIELPKPVGRRISASGQQKRPQRKSSATGKTSRRPAKAKQAPAANALPSALTNGDQVAVPHELGILTLRNAVVFPDAIDAGLFASAARLRRTLMKRSRTLACLRGPSFG